VVQCLCWRLYSTAVFVWTDFVRGDRNRRGASFGQIRIVSRLQPIRGGWAADIGVIPGWRNILQAPSNSPRPLDHTSSLPESYLTVSAFTDLLIRNIETVIVGKRTQIELLMVALLCQGHVLLEDVPGTGKTMLARATAVSLGTHFNRLQCTPDLLPNDITGVSVYNQQTNQFEFRPGPVFANIVLADEINRATPRTQAALLEAMQERQVTADGVTRPLPAPFLVLATQNPIEYEGTFPLPEAQLDRFLIRLSLGYPEVEDEAQILSNLRKQHPIEALGQVLEADQLPDLLARLYDIVTDVHVDASLVRYILSIVRATRSHPDVALGASPRGSLALFKTSQAWATLRGRDYVLPDDIKMLVPFALAHRLIVRPESQLRGRTAESILAQVLEQAELDLEPAAGHPTSA
jgi:MoxR-like ATPase